MLGNFPRALALVLKSEGGFVNNAHDPGGATNFGITQRVYSAYRSGAGSVKFISDEDVRAIYQRQYWDAVQADDLWTGLDYVLFDEAVNSGPVKSIIDLQTALGIKADGHLGAVTMAALRTAPNRAVLINRICDLRLSFLHRLKTWRFFGKGWSNRVNGVRAAALKMSAAQVIKSIVPANGPALKRAA